MGPEKGGLCAWNKQPSPHWKATQGPQPITSFSVMEASPLGQLLSTDVMNQREGNEKQLSRHLEGPVSPTTQLHCDPRETEKTVTFSPFLMVFRSVLAYQRELKCTGFHLTVQRVSQEIYDSNKEAALHIVTQGFLSVNLASCLRDARSLRWSFPAFFWRVFAG